jgi:hypothetical protein
VTLAVTITMTAQQREAYADARGTGFVELEITRRSPAEVVTALMMPLALLGEFEKPGKLREFIEGFN